MGVVQGDGGASLLRTAVRAAESIATPRPDDELRATSDEPEFCKHLELVVMAKPGVDAVLSRRRNAWLASAKARKSAPVPDAPGA